ADRASRYARCIVASRRISFYPDMRIKSPPAHADDIHATIASLADPTRTRLLLLLSRHELSGNELYTALQLPPSTVSRHLKHLWDDGWLITRSEGPSRYYRMAPRLERTPKRLWQAIRDDLVTQPDAAQDEARATQVLSERRTRSQEFFSSTAGQWDALRAE